MAALPASPTWAAARTRPSQRVYWECSAVGLERHPQQRAVGAGDEGAAAPEQDLGDHDSREARRGRVDQPARAQERGAHEERPAVADAIGDVAGGELEEDHREAEHGLEQEDVGERQPDLILPEQRDDRDREQRELQRAERDEQARVGRHEGTAPAPNGRRDVMRDGHLS